MQISESEKILKELAKDEESYNKLVSIFNGLHQKYNSLTNFFSSNISSFYCIETFGESEIIYSDSICNIVGFNSIEILELPGHLISLVVEEDKPSVKKYMSKLDGENDEEFLSINFRVRRKDEETIWLNLVSNVVKEKNDIKQIIHFYTEISDLKKSQQEFYDAKENLVELNKTKDRFLSIVSHDLRAPFTSLLGFSEILINEPNLPFDERIEYLKYIHDASKNQLQFINHLLDWSKLQTGKIQYEPKRINAKSLVSNCISLLIGAAIRKDIEIKSNVDENISLYADERLLSQAVTNLINNSIKFTHEGKKINVIANTFKAGMIEIVVRDEGVGIDEKNQDKLFKIDKKFSLEGTKGEKGSGLGLALVKEIVEKHGGDIWFYSKINEGTEFHITIPEAQNVVVLVEDDLTLRQLYKKIIKKLISNFNIIEAENGYDAMSIVLNQSPSLIITDHEMPLMNGIQLVEALRKKDSSASVPVIVVSAKLSSELIEKYQNLRVNHIITKPFKQAELIQHIQDCVS